MQIISRPSPNFTNGRTQPITKIVCHWMVSTLASADTHIRNPASQVSAHYGIGEGKIYRWVAENATAWHARQANPFSIGIEHSAAPGRPATNDTYNKAIELIADICRRYKLNPDTAIEPHSKYVATQCPGTMDLQKIKNGVKSKLGVKMISAHGLNVLFRFYLGGAPNADQRKAFVGKKTFDEVSQWITNGATFKGKVKAASEGRLGAHQHLPAAIRQVYKAPPVTGAKPLGKGLWEVK